MSTEVVVTDTCIHPEITMETTTAANWDYTVYCTACHKKIIIPMTTIEQGEKESFIGIVAEVFGEEVAQRLSRWT